MKRLRLVFVILSALLWLPLSFLVSFALRTVEQEESGRYKAVADRIFDEMERELTALLRREEERPYGAYAELFASTTPLADGDASYVLTYFERDASGVLRHTPLRAGAQPVLQLLERHQKLARSAEPTTAQSQSPGSTLELKRKGEPLAKSYDVLSSLNRSAALREEVKQAKSRSKLALKEDAASNLYDPAWGTRADGAPKGAVAPGPLSGEPLGEGRLLLVRSSAGVVQGVVIDLRELLGWLSKRVLERGDLRHAAHIVPLETAAPRAIELGGENRGYQHRFGEPFSSLTALLTLDVLPELEASRYNYLLSAALLVLGAVALYAGYRTVAAVVGYAERRSNFVSAVTHELKTPLTSIRMYGEMLRDDVVPDPQKRSRYYRIITAESERLTRLIDNVLELARLERGQRPVSLALGDVSGVVRETLEVLEPHASELGFSLELEVASELPSVPFDRDALSQVLFNLVDNALKYGSEAEQRSVTIRCETHGKGVLIRVADRGPGVAPEHLTRIWQPFYRAERELTRKHKGTGIGLSLVRGLVERMGGQVSGRNTHPGFEVSVSLGP
ncbi:MAG TPA: HAMP domain-containing sensor histidine kinase [Polyangiales bacterium]|nr:HAMP domain-containing sensor histidine kinase [Polyangiales bacterium]